MVGHSSSFQCNPLPSTCPLPPARAIAPVFSLRMHVTCILTGGGESSRPKRARVTVERLTPSFIPSRPTFKGGGKRKVRQVVQQTSISLAEQLEELADSYPDITETLKLAATSLVDQHKRTMRIGELELEVSELRALLSSLKDASTVDSDNKQQVRVCTGWARQIGDRRRHSRALGRGAKAHHRQPLDFYVGHKTKRKTKQVHGLSWLSFYWRCLFCKLFALLDMYYIGPRLSQIEWKVRFSASLSGLYFAARQPPSRSSNEYYFE